MDATVEGSHNNHLMVVMKAADAYLEVGVEEEWDAEVDVVEVSEEDCHKHLLLA